MNLQVRNFSDKMNWQNNIKQKQPAFKSSKAATEAAKVIPNAIVIPALTGAAAILASPIRLSKERCLKEYSPEANLSNKSARESAQVFKQAGQKRLCDIFTKGSPEDIDNVILEKDPELISKLNEDYLGWKIIESAFVVNENPDSIEKMVDLVGEYHLLSRDENNPFNVVELTFSYNKSPEVIERLIDLLGEDRVVSREKEANNNAVELAFRYNQNPKVIEKIIDKMGIDVVTYRNSETSANAVENAFIYNENPDVLEAIIDKLGLEAVTTSKDEETFSPVELAFEYNQNPEVKQRISAKIRAMKNGEISDKNNAEQNDDADLIDTAKDGEMLANADNAANAFDYTNGEKAVILVKNVFYKSLPIAALMALGWWASSSFVKNSRLNNSNEIYSSIYEMPNEVKAETDNTTANYTDYVVNPADNTRVQKPFVADQSAQDWLKKSKAQPIRKMNPNVDKKTITPSDNTFVYNNNLLLKSDNKNKNSEEADDINETTKQQAPSNIMPADNTATPNLAPDWKLGQTITDKNGNNKFMYYRSQTNAQNSKTNPKISKSKLTSAAEMELIKELNKAPIGTVEQTPVVKEPWEMNVPNVNFNVPGNWAELISQNETIQDNEISPEIKITQKTPNPLYQKEQKMVMLYNIEKNKKVWELENKLVELNKLRKDNNTIKPTDLTDVEKETRKELKEAKKELAKFYKPENIHNEAMKTLDTKIKEYGLKARMYKNSEDAKDLEKADEAEAMLNYFKDLKTKALNDELTQADEYKIIAYSMETKYQLAIAIAEKAANGDKKLANSLKNMIDSYINQYDALIKALPISNMFNELSSNNNYQVSLREIYMLKDKEIKAELINILKANYAEANIDSNNQEFPISNSELLKLFDNLIEN